MSNSRNSTNSLIEEQQQVDQSTSTFVTSVVFNSIFAVIFFTAFVLISQLKKEFYYPKVSVGPSEKRPPPPPTLPHKWFYHLMFFPPHHFIRRAGLDAYMFIRYLRVCTKLFALFSVIALPILLPLNSVGQKNTKGLPRFAIGNVVDTPRLWAHCFCAVLFVGLALYMLKMELKHCLTWKFKYLNSTGYRSRLRARTVLITGVPPELLEFGAESNHDSKLYKLFEQYGSIDAITKAHDIGVTEGLAQKRDESVYELEKAYMELLRTGVRPVKASKSVHKVPVIRTLATTTGVAEPAESIDVIDHLTEKIKNTDRTLTEVREKILRTDHSAPQQQTDYSNFVMASAQGVIGTAGGFVSSAAQIAGISSKPVTNIGQQAVFVTYQRQRDAQWMAQSLVGKDVFRMNECWGEISPGAVIWENLGVWGINRWWRQAVSILISSVMIILWSAIVTFVSSVSTLSNLTDLVPFLKPILTWPNAIIGFIQGVLPAVAVAILMALLPKILAALSRFEGIPLETEVQLSVMHKYFFFLVVNVLIVATLASGIFSTLSSLRKSLESGISILATKMPTSSTFFITYVILQGFTSSTKMILNIGGAAVNYVMQRFISKTPRDFWKLLTDLDPVDWGVTFPPIVLVFCIGMTYSVIAPLILPFAVIFFFAFDACYRYMFLYVNSLPSYYSLNGKALHRAILHSFVGLYIFQLTLIGIFSLNQAIPQLVVMVVSLVGTVAANRYMDKGFAKLINWMPAETMLEQVETDSKNAESLNVESGISGNKDNVLMTSPPTTGRLESPEKPEKPEKPERSEKDRPRRPSNIDIASMISAVDSEQINNYYLHPALRTSAPVIWLPRDDEGVAQQQVDALIENGLDATCDGALYQNGKVKIELDEVTLRDQIKLA